MILTPPISTRTDTLFPYPPLYRSVIDRRIEERDILLDRAGMEQIVLLDDAEVAAERGEAPLRQRFALDGDLAAGGRMEAEQQLEQRRFAAARRAGDRDRIAGGDGQAGATQEIGRASRGERVCQYV